MTTNEVKPGTMKRGDRFVHAHYMDQDRAPIVCKVTKIAHGVVYYRPDYGQHEDGAEWLGAPYYFSLQNDCSAPFQSIADWYNWDERETAIAIHAIHGLPGEPEPEVEE